MKTQSLEVSLMKQTHLTNQSYQVETSWRSMSSERIQNTTQHTNQYQYPKKDCESLHTNTYQTLVGAQSWLKSMQLQGLDNREGRNLRALFYLNWTLPRKIFMLHRLKKNPTLGLEVWGPWLRLKQTSGNKSFFKTHDNYGHINWLRHRNSIALRNITC